MRELLLTFIGTGNAFVPEGMCWNGFLANGQVLFEAPPTALMALRRMGRDPAAVETVLISHHHGDHFLGLPMLLLHWKYFGRDSRATVLGPPGTYEKARAITDQVYPGVFGDDLPVDWVTIRGGEQAQVGRLAVTAYSMRHDARLECLGYRCNLDGHEFGYTGDTALCEAVLALGRGAAVLVAECTSLAERSNIHMNLQEDIARLREELPGETSILLTHLSAPVPEPGLEGVRAADDFASYRFQRS